jgi:hypothetical protein
LPAGNGTKTVYAQFRDGVSNLSDAVTDTITLEADVAPPVLTLSVQGGTYSTSQAIAITSNEAATIYYTTDGSTPTMSSMSILAGMAIPISSSMTPSTLLLTL